MVLERMDSPAMPDDASYKPMLLHLEGILQARQEEKEAQEASALLAEKRRRDKLPKLPGIPLNSARSSNGSEPVAATLSLPQVVDQVLTRKSGGPLFSHWERLRWRSIKSLKAEMLAKLSDERDRVDDGQRRGPLSEHRHTLPGTQAVGVHRKAVSFEGDLPRRSARVRGSLDAATPGTRYLLAHRTAPERTRMAREMQFRPAEQLVRALIMLRDDDLARQLAMTPAPEPFDDLLPALKEERQRRVNSAHKAMALATLPLIKAEQAKLEASDFSLLHDYGYAMPHGLKAKCVWAKAKAIIFLQSTRMIVEPEVQAHLALFNLQRNAACDLIASGKVLTEVTSEVQRALLPGWQLGNTDLYEREALELRRELFYSTLVQAALENWWDVISDSFRSAAAYKQHLHMKEYALLNKLIHKALVPDPSEAEMELCSKTDWERTVPQQHGVRVLSAGAWNTALFWLADLWTDGISAHEYASFLMKLLDGVTCLKDRFVHPKLEPDHREMDEDKRDDEEKDVAGAIQDGNEDDNDNNETNGNLFDGDALQAELEAEKVQASFVPNTQEHAYEEPAPDPPVPQEAYYVPVVKKVKERRNSMSAPKVKRSGQSHRLDDEYGVPSPGTDFFHPMKTYAPPDSVLLRTSLDHANKSKLNTSGKEPSDVPPSEVRRWRVSMAPKPKPRPDLVSPLDSLLEPATSIMDGWEEAADEAQREQMARAELLEMHPGRGSEDPSKLPLEDPSLSLIQDPQQSHLGRGSEELSKSTLEEPVETNLGRESVDPTPSPLPDFLEVQQVPRKRKSVKPVLEGVSGRNVAVTSKSQEPFKGKLAGNEMDFRGRPYKDERHWVNTERRLLSLSEVRCIAWQLSKASHATSKRVRRTSDFHLVNEDLGPALVRKAKQNAHRRTLKRLKLFRRYILDGADVIERKGEVKALTDVPQFLVHKKADDDVQPSETEVVDVTIDLEVESEHNADDSEKGEDAAEIQMVRENSGSNRLRTPLISTYPEEAILLPSVAARVARQSHAVQEFRRMTQPGFLVQDDDSEDEKPFFKVETPEAPPKHTADSVVTKSPGIDGGPTPIDGHQESGMNSILMNTLRDDASSPLADGLHVKAFDSDMLAQHRPEVSALSLTRINDAMLGVPSEESPTIGNVKLGTEELSHKEAAVFNKEHVWLQADKHLLLSHVRPNRMSVKAPRTREPVPRRPRISAGPRMGDTTNPTDFSLQEKSALSMSFTGGNLSGMRSTSLPRMSTNSLRNHLLGKTASRLGNLEEKGDEGNLVGGAIGELRCEGSVPGTESDALANEKAQADDKAVKKARTRKKIKFEDGEHMIKVQEFPTIRLRPTQRWSKVKADEVAQNSSLSKLRNIRHAMPSQAAALGTNSTTGMKTLPSARSFYTSSKIAQSETMEKDTSVLNSLVARSKARKQGQASGLRPP